MAAPAPGISTTRVVVEASGEGDCAAAEVTDTRPHTTDINDAIHRIRIAHLLDSILGGPVRGSRAERPSTALRHGGDDQTSYASNGRKVAL
jgi:hypothetical protein